MKRSSSRRNRGFTLIEVLLVLVILVILASLAVVNLINVKKGADLKAAKVQIGLLSDALNHYQLDVGSFPSTQTGLQALVVKPSDIPDPDKWMGPYLNSEIPVDPWNRPYQYEYPGKINQSSFDVSTVSPDNKVIGNWNEEVRR
jgi:general secretion pathway protein G